MTHPTALIILDGFGHSATKAHNAIAQAHTPTLDFLQTHYPHTLLAAAGKAVGLPKGYMGNSEVGHVTIGAGRVIPSLFLRLHEAIENKSLLTNPILITHLKKLATTQQPLQIMGLLSDAGVNSHLEIIKPLVEAALQNNIQKIFLHAFLDGRDTLPQAAATYLKQVDMLSTQYNQLTLGSITGRFYAMDRDTHWDRTEKTYAMLTHATSPSFSSWQQALEHYYAQRITDEFIPPTLINAQALIKKHDGIIFFNHREDRARQLTACFVAPEEVPFHPTLHPLFFLTPIQFDKKFNNPILFTHTPATNTLKQMLSAHHKTMFSIAETEKYAHVTYFFADGNEAPFPGEQRVLIPSLGLANYAEQPCMSAPAITQAVIHSLRTKPCDFYLINYANADMVGHSGNFEATVKAIECLDEQIKKLYEEMVQKMNGILYITADHGNAEKKYDETTGQPWTAHTANPVPFIVVDKKIENSAVQLPLQGLADVAPFILQQIGLKESVG